jgi:hypothetical protein
MEFATTAISARNNITLQIMMEELCELVISKV